jgi:hypothetical protein
VQLLKGNLEHAVTKTILTMTLSLIWGAILTIVITLAARGLGGLALTAIRAATGRAAYEAGSRARTAVAMPD